MKAPEMRRRSRPGFMCAAILALLAGLVLGPSLAPGKARPVVYVAPIEGVIDLGLAPFIRRVLDEAAEAGAAGVILEINTFGGRVDAAVVIRDALLNSRLRTVAFVNKRAISAGALISLAAERIVMTGGATIGAATPVRIDSGGKANPVSEKTVSYLRKEFRATAESRKRPPLLAEAMVDADVEIAGVIEKGKLLTFTTQEALEHKIADFRADTLADVLERLNLAGAEVRHVSQNWAESLVRFVTNPVLSSLLMTVGILGIFVELRVPGFGLPGAVGIGSLALFFWGHSLVHLAGMEELLLAGAGLLLLALEVFVIPGFGIAGILGIAAIVAGLAMSLIGGGSTGQAIMGAVGQVGFSLFVAVAAGIWLLRLMPRTPFGGKMVLQTSLSRGAGIAPESEGERRWLGKRGVAASPLRPTGIATIEGERVDVVSEGDYIEAGAPIEAIGAAGSRTVVRRRNGPPEKE
ncbi:MAG: NfeD family protein [bacterium]